MRAVIYGAGNIGRGFIARLLSDSGYEISFIDVAEPLVNSLNNVKRYPVRLLSAGTSQDVWIEGIRAINGSDSGKTIQAIAETDIMATAVGVRILPLIAPVLAQGIKKRLAGTGKPLNIIICENLIDADKVLEKLIKETLDIEEQKLFDKKIGLIKASIGCMVPIQTDFMKDGNALRICTEDYSLLPVDKKAFRGEIPLIQGMEVFDNFDFYIERKLFIHNMGHGICAYMGLYQGDEFIWETINKPEIIFMAQNAMLESALALSKKYNAPITELYRHITDLIRRFSNKSLGDTCLRVGADTARKLGEKDRFAGAIKCCEENDIRPLFISAGTAAALVRHIKDNNLEQTTTQAGAILREISCIPENSGTSGLILSMYSFFLETGALPKTIGHILSLW